MPQQDFNTSIAAYGHDSETNPVFSPFFSLQKAVLELEESLGDRLQIE